MFRVGESVINEIKRFLQNFHFDRALALETGLLYSVGDCGNGCRDTCAGGCATSCSGTCEGGCSGAAEGGGWWE